ncbi:sulfur carrier protein [Desulfonauticus submarinus]|uniref:Sulfur carrier protein n=2 Tax=Desulfonauticus submarinus TaxID=206665 RepID=A0A1G9ZZA7_9BACT|nr:sulfur carrier protein [Desulfonauticus submarinus]
MQKHRIMKIIIEPENKEVELKKIKSVRALLNKLNLYPNQALIIRNKELLTPDEKLFPNDTIIVRKVASRG